jgi:hypothetical protein
MGLFCAPSSDVLNNNNNNNNNKEKKTRVLEE